MLGNYLCGYVLWLEKNGRIWKRADKEKAQP